MAIKIPVEKNWLLTRFNRYYSTNAFVAGPGEALVEWDTVSGASGYRVYYTQTDPTTTLVFDQVVGSGIDAGNVLYKLLTGLSPAGTWYFATTAYDSNGYETEYSTVISKVVS